MEKSLKKSVSAFGIFASGLVVGYAASLLSLKSNHWYSQLRGRVGQLSMPKILPTIPELDSGQISIEVETQLGMDE